MVTIYEDNFGFWEIDCQEESAFFAHVQSQSVRASCQRCRRPVRLMSTKTICAACVSALECGAPSSIRKYGSRDIGGREARCLPRRLLRPPAQ